MIKKRARCLTPLLGSAIFFLLRNGLALGHNRALLNAMDEVFNGASVHRKCLFSQTGTNLPRR